MYEENRIKKFLKDDTWDKIFHGGDGDILYKFLKNHGYKTVYYYTSFLWCVGDGKKIISNTEGDIYKTIVKDKNKYETEVADYKRFAKENY
jgi:hypothetical protein